jgi:triacylglycerol lipase
MPKPAPVYSIEFLFRPERDKRYVHFENAADHRFQPDPTGFPRVNVWWLSDAALLSYWDPASAKAIFERAGLQSEFVKEGSTDCYVAWQDEFVIVVFRGTESNEWRDILTDAKTTLVPWTWTVGNVHLGFKEAITTIWPTLERLLNDLSRSRTVWFCGHSLGAALAVLAADRFRDTRGVCTIGCPRVGDHSLPPRSRKSSPRKVFATSTTATPSLTCRSRPWGTTTSRSRDSSRQTAPSPRLHCCYFSTSPSWWDRLKSCWQSSKR